MVDGIGIGFGLGGGGVLRRFGSSMDSEGVVAVVVAVNGDSDVGCSGSGGVFSEVGNSSGVGGFVLSAVFVGDAEMDGLEERNRGKHRLI
uniref:Uncharacterized protein n=1 Tax=Panagrolaimus sp. JU765 TaxID=591449 RepID=A0AC34QXL0_9BILA